MERKQIILTLLSMVIGVFACLLVFFGTIIAIGPIKNAEVICYPSPEQIKTVNRALQLELLSQSFLGLFKKASGHVYRVGDENKKDSFIASLPYEYARDWSHHMQLKDPHTGKLIINELAKVDQFGRRATYLPDHKKTYSLLVFGDSWIYGDYLNDKDTFPSQLAKQLPQAEVHNYGIRGSGPNHALVSLAKLNPVEEQLMPKGVVLFIWEMWQYWRTIPYPHNIPFVSCRTSATVSENNENLELILANSPTELHPARTPFMLFLNIAKIKYWFRWHNRPKETGNEMQKVCPYFLKMKQLVKQKLPGYQFLVLNYPGISWGEKLLKECLEKVSIEYLNTEPLDINDFDPKYYLPDGHPNGLQHKLAAERTANALRPYLEN